jgi:prepilin-type N-terminal cleavage/methylation domain-containing protein/prepilin-type processing-associated H-X9-DG protein
MIAGFAGAAAGTRARGLARGPIAPTEWGRRAGWKAAAGEAVRARHRAFTLVELLVVIAVIAILAALLLPGLARARGLAWRTECQNRMRQWTLALLMYKDDHGDEIPCESYEKFGNTYRNNWAQVRGARGGAEDVWYNALARYVKAPPASSYFEEPDRFYRRSVLFHCPAARFPPRSAESPYAMFSIAMNSQLIALPYIPTIKFSRIRYEAQTALFVENRLDGEPKVSPQQPNTDLGQPATYALRFVPRHSAGGNLSFADGHVGWFRGNRVVETQGLGAGGPILPPVDVRWDPD